MKGLGLIFEKFGWPERVAENFLIKKSTTSGWEPLDNTLFSVLWDRRGYLGGTRLMLRATETKTCSKKSEPLINYTPFGRFSGNTRGYNL